MPAFPEATIGTGQLLLTPLGQGDADELAEVLADPELHRSIGGRPATVQELRDRYRALEAGSPRAGEVWRNWVVRRRADARPVGTVQATIGRRDGSWTAEIAWVVGVARQGRGYGSEAAGRWSPGSAATTSRRSWPTSPTTPPRPGSPPGPASGPPPTRSTASRSGGLDRGREPPRRG